MEAKTPFAWGKLVERAGREELGELAYRCTEGSRGRICRRVAGGEV